MRMERQLNCHLLQKLLYTCLELSSSESFSMKPFIGQHIKKLITFFWIEQSFQVSMFYYYLVTQKSQKNGPREYRIAPRILSKPINKLSILRIKNRIVYELLYRFFSYGKDFCPSRVPMGQLLLYFLLVDKNLRSRRHHDPVTQRRKITQGA